jgi:hypothetical protein
MIVLTQLDYFFLCLRYSSINKIFNKTARITGMASSHRFANKSIPKNIDANTTTTANITPTSNEAIARKRISISMNVTVTGSKLYFLRPLYHFCSLLQINNRYILKKRIILEVSG